MHDASVREQIDALEAERGVLDLDGWGATEVRGADAEAWLNDLVTASVDRLESGRTVRSLLLGPTGRIRADVHVARRGGGFLLLQGPGQPDPIAVLLAPYVLSSEVEIISAETDGLSLMPRRDPRWAIGVEESPTGGARVGRTAFEAWRVRHGIPAFPDDVGPDSLPSEAGLDEEPVVDRAKGCYLGQESVARVRNLGHPPRLVMSVKVAGAVHIGDSVFSTGERVGIVTSLDPDGPAALIRVRWDARDSELTTDGGIPLPRR